MLLALVDYDTVVTSKLSNFIIGTMGVALNNWYYDS